MPRSAGTYTPPASTWSPAVNAASATFGDWNSLLTDIANALTQSLSLDGQSTPTGNIPMGGFKLTGLGNGTATTDAAAYGQVTAAMPPGATLDYAGSAAPTGFLLCDGSAVNRITFSALFAAIGTTWGAGDGSTTFNVPDARGRTTIGAGTGSGLTARTVGTQNIGEETHVLTTAELAAHNHTVTDPGHVHAITDPTHTHSWGNNNQASTAGTGNLGGFGGSSSPTTAASTGITINSVTTGITTVNAGSGTAHNNMQPSAVFTKIIKT